MLRVRLEFTFFFPTTTSQPKNHDPLPDSKLACVVSVCLRDVHVQQYDDEVLLARGVVRESLCKEFLAQGQFP